MKPKPQPRDAFELFQAHFDQILNRDHALVQLADKIDWTRFDEAFADNYSPDMGAPAKAARLMVGLQYLKYTFNESDELVVDRWVENPYWQYFYVYWQYFCGYTHMQHEVHIAGQRNKNTTRAERKRRRHRSAIEPKIGHLKSDHRMGRCFLARLCGDAINAILAAAGSNLRKLLGLLGNQSGRLCLCADSVAGACLDTVQRPLRPRPRAA